MAPRPEDERPHPHGGDGWSERWSFDFASADGELGGWVTLTRFAGHAWYQAALAGPRRQLLAVLDHHVPFRSNPMEVRTTDLWADHVCEEPHEHWTLGLEAFALGVDDPLELHGRQHGDRVPLGFDLEWEADGPVLPAGAGPVEGYGQGCRVHGEVLVGADVLDLDGVGSRSHEWGPGLADVDGWHLSGVVEGQVRWAVDHRGGLTTVRRVAADGSVAEELARASVDVDDEGLPVAAAVAVGDDELRAEVLAVTPVPLDDGRRRPRALCRYRTRDGRVGVGWVELRGGPRAAVLGG